MGIPVPADVREVLRGALRGAETDLAGLRRTDPDGWHLTLAFVGALPDADLARLHAAVDRGIAGAGRPVDVALEIDHADRFGTHVLFYGVADRPPGTLARLGASIQTTIDTAGLPVDRRAVRPHVTVARGRRTGRVTDEAVAAIRATVPRGPAVAWTPPAVALYRAVDRDGPARYEVEASVPLSSD